MINREGYTASVFAHMQRLASDETYQALGLEEGRKGQGVVALVPRVGELGEVLADGGVEGVVVGDVGREAADLLALSGESDDLGELLSGYNYGLVSAKQSPRGVKTYSAQGCRPSPAYQSLVSLI